MTLDGLTTFAPIWAAATMPSVAGDRHVLLLKDGVLQFALGWAAFAAAALLMIRPRAIWLLLVVAGVMAVRYASNLPVASNNKTMSFFMNGAILAISAQALVAGLKGADFRAQTYERLRIVAGGLLAVETITLVSLYWRRYFAVGLFFLAFHFVIPISADSWCMDFSSLVLALYVLAIPREATEKFYETFARCFRALRVLRRTGPAAAVRGGRSAILSLSYPGRQGGHIYHSVWLLLWAVYHLTQGVLAQAPDAWISYRRGGVLHERATAASFTAGEHANWLERTFLLFKPVDFARPKVYTH